MMKIISFIKHYTWVWIIVLVLFAVIGDAILTQKQKQPPSPTPIPKIASYNSITPGVNTKTDLDRLLGSPLRTIKQEDQTRLEYKSTNVNRPHIAFERNGVVELIKEIVNSTDKKTVSDIVSVYGEPTHTLYSKNPNNTYNLYVYSQNGIAYLAHADGTLLEIWYFIPMTIEDFVKNWAPDYSESTPPPNQYY